MGARKPFSGGKIANKLKGYENPFVKTSSKTLKNDMLEYHRKSKQAHVIVDERKPNFKSRKNKFSLEDDGNYENDCALGDFDEPVPDLLYKPKVSNKMIESKMMKIEKRIARGEKFNKLNEIDKMFDDIRQDLSFKKATSIATDEFDSIRSRFSAGSEVKIAKPPETHRPLYHKLKGSNSHSVPNLLSLIKSEASNIKPGEIPELIDFCIEFVSTRLKNRNDWLDFALVASEILLSKHGKVYQFFLNCTKIMYKRLLTQYKSDVNFIEEVDDWTLDSSCNTFVELFNGNPAIELATIIFTVNIFPINSTESDCKLGHISLLLLDHIARISLSEDTNSMHLHYEYFTVLYTIAMQNDIFIPLLFEISKKIILKEIAMDVQLVEEVIASTAIALKHLSITSKCTQVLSHIWYNNEMEINLKKYKKGYLLTFVINQLNESGLQPLSLLNSQSKTCIMETPKLILYDNIKKKDSLKKAIMKEKKLVSKMISQESKVVRDEQILGKLKHKQNVEKRYKQILSAAMIEREELKKEATRGI